MIFTLLFWGVFAFSMIGQEAKQEREGVRDMERSVSRGSNSGHPKRNSVICHGLEFFIADLFEMSSRSGW